MRDRQFRLRLVFLVICLACVSTLGAEQRRVVSLDGTWEVEQGSRGQVPARFDHTVPVPGLVDMAQPAFTEVGTTNRLREAFWYRKAFRVEGRLPTVALLKVHKASFGSRVYVNGQFAGEHLSSFTPGYFEVRRFLHDSGAPNEVIISVGAHRDAVPPHLPTGWDFEKKSYLPGIYDSVELILSGPQHIARVQTAPDLTNQCVRVQATVRNYGKPAVQRLKFTVREARSGRIVGARDSAMTAFEPGEERTVDTVISLRDCHPWSPDDPFLYELVTDTGSDLAVTRFGMRSFWFDPSTGHAFLNGRKYFLRGSNVTLYRFFEDPERGDRPWREDWVRRLHRRFKEMHWDTLRYCIGFPPEMWYRIADEEGFLIQDEYPLWHLSGQRLKDSWPKELTSEQLAREYTEWLQERWNHPSVVIWDAQNETVTEETGKAIARVRSLDLSNRPWDNGWGVPQAPGDCFESHPYLFSNPNFRLSGLAGVAGVPTGNPTPNQNKNAIILNEYGWLWLNRDGTPTTLTREVYKNLLGEDATAEQRRQLYARYLAALTEFWRAHRACAGVLHFCGLGYSRPDGQTSDHFLDLEQLTYEPNFFNYVRDAFSPVGVMVGFWDEELEAGAVRDVPVTVINDLARSWAGQVRLRLLRDGAVLLEESQRIEVEANGRGLLNFAFTAPARPDRYEMEAALLPNSESAPGRRARGGQKLVSPGKLGEPQYVRSQRAFDVLTPVQKKARNGQGLGRPVKASSVLTKDGTTYRAEFAVDGDTTTRWSSEFSDPQWLEMDLGPITDVARVELFWEAAYARSYSIEVSTDRENWTEVYATEKGKGGREVIKFPKALARCVRLKGTQRATEYGYSLWEMRVFAK